jgi:hypothetical protein
MPFSDPSQIHITSEVYDFMFIRIDDPKFQRHSLQYAILDNSGQLIRKGLFRGNIIQLRLSHLEDGMYNLSLSVNRQSVTHQFTKKTGTTGQQTMFSF